MKSTVCVESLWAARYERPEEPSSSFAGASGMAVYPGLGVQA